MSAKLYVRCETCQGMGTFTDGVGVVHQCACYPVRVHETGLVMDQVEALHRELARARLRMAALERELRDWHARAFEGAAGVDPVALTVDQVVRWWRSARPSDQTAFTAATGLRLGGGGMFVHLAPRDETGSTPAKGA